VPWPRSIGLREQPHAGALLTLPAPSTPARCNRSSGRWARSSRRRPLRGRPLALFLGILGPKSRGISVRPPRRARDNRSSWPSAFASMVSLPRRHVHGRRRSAGAAVGHPAGATAAAAGGAHSYLRPRGANLFWGPAERRRAGAARIAHPAMVRGVVGHPAVLMRRFSSSFGRFFPSNLSLLNFPLSLFPTRVSRHYAVATRRTLRVLSDSNCGVIIGPARPCS